jgi:galactokinase/mevalonate kinase-like predicted kinase
MIISRTSLRISFMGGGFLVFYALPERHPAIISALSELSPTPFRFEPQGGEIIYVEN